MAVQASGDGSVEFPRSVISRGAGFPIGIDRGYLSDASENWGKSGNYQDQSNVEVLIRGSTHSFTRLISRRDEPLSFCLNNLYNRKPANTSDGFSVVVLTSYYQRFLLPCRRSC